MFVSFRGMLAARRTQARPSSDARSHAQRHSASPDAIGLAFRSCSYFNLQASAESQRDSIIQPRHLRNSVNNFF